MLGAVLGVIMRIWVLILSRWCRWCLVMWFVLIIIIVWLCRVSLVRQMGVLVLLRGLRGRLGVGFGRLVRLRAWVVVWQWLIMMEVSLL